MAVDPQNTDLAGLREQIKDVLRRDLKLDPGEPIADDMPLVGGDAEVDSIDVLLIVGTLEREFGVSIPDRDVSERAFATVDSLTRYVAEQQAAAGGGGEVGRGRGAGGRAGGLAGAAAARAGVPLRQRRLGAAAR